MAQSAPVLWSAPTSRRYTYLTPPRSGVPGDTMNVVNSPRANFAGIPFAFAELQFLPNVFHHLGRLSVTAMKGLPAISLRSIAGWADEIASPLADAGITVTRRRYRHSADAFPGQIGR
jgi:hypothetical protein